MNLMRIYMTKSLLLASGLLAAGISTTILFVPHLFYSDYGFDITSNVSLANEMKAPMGILLAAGLFMLAGVFRSRIAGPALAVAALIYLSYGLSRLVSIAIDGVPHSGLVVAAVIELVIGALCLTEWLPRRNANAG